MPGLPRGADHIDRTGNIPEYGWLISPPKLPCIGADADLLRTQQRRFRERHYVGPVLLGAIGEDYQSHPWEQPVNSAFYQSLKGAIKSGSLVSA